MLVRLGCGQLSQTKQLDIRDHRLFEFSLVYWYIFSPNELNDNLKTVFLYLSKTIVCDKEVREEKM